MRMRLFAILVMLLSTTFWPAAAQSNQLPLYFLLQQDVSDNPTGADSYFGGDLWKWDSSGLKQITHWGFNHAPVLSPDGKTMAYQSLPQIAVDYLNSDASHAEGVVDSALPLNIWLMDVQSAQAARIADQNPAAYIDAPNFDLVGGITRSIPAWSPDGQQLAWIEADSSSAMSVGLSETFDPYLMVYDLTTHQTQITIPHLKLPNYESPATGGTGISDILLLWGKMGLVMSYLSSQDAAFAAVIVNLGGDFVSEIETHYFSTEDHLTEWVNDGKQTYLAIGTPDQWSLFDIATGKSVPFDGVVEAYNPLAPNGVALRVNADYMWEFGSASQPFKQLDNCDISNFSIAISPDGQSVACPNLFNLTLDVYNASGVVASIPLDKPLFGLSWGKLAWRISNTVG